VFECCHDHDVTDGRIGSKTPALVAYSWFMPVCGGFAGGCVFRTIDGCQAALWEAAIRGAVD
jgi:hypothetical protein